MVAQERPNVRVFFKEKSKQNEVGMDRTCIEEGPKGVFDTVDQVAVQSLGGM